MSDPDKLLAYLRKISKKDCENTSYSGSSLTYQDIDEAIEMIELLQQERDEVTKQHLHLRDWLARNHPFRLADYDAEQRWKEEDSDE